MDHKDIKRKLCYALLKFAENDAELIDLEVSEWAVTHQIACYLKEPFSDWDVDCEYNRKKLDVKKDKSDRNKRPDIVVHHRNTNHNLLIIEVKKSGENTEDDDKELKEFTDKSGNYGYDFGIQLIIPRKNKPDPDTMNLSLRWYENGDHNAKRDILRI
ncbi:hypothetical protein J2129_001652 [Methanofollis sp. W23]|nr:hypothetical protein [Methanofollis sp. W23]